MRPCGAEVVTAPAPVWELFDFACGQRPRAAALRTEAPRLREAGEFKCSEAIAAVQEERQCRGGTAELDACAQGGGLPVLRYVVQLVCSAATVQKLLPTDYEGGMRGALWGQASPQV